MATARIVTSGKHLADGQAVNWTRRRAGHPDEVVAAKVLRAWDTIVAIRVLGIEGPEGVLFAAPADLEAVV